MGFLLITGRLPLIAENDPHATVEVGQFPQPCREGGVIERAGEDFKIGLETDGGAGLARLCCRLRLRRQCTDRSTALEALAMHLALTAHRHLHPLTQGVHRHPNAVQTAGHLVTTSAKLAAGVQHGEHRLQGALAGARVHIGGNAATVIAHRGGAVFPQHDNDAVAMARRLRPPSYRRPRTDGASPAARWSRCTCPDACERAKPLQHLNLLTP